MTGALDPRTPVVVGVGQVKHKPVDPADAREPLALMVDAVRAAAIDAGDDRLLAKADRIAVVGGLWRYSDPARLIGDAVGATGATTVLTPFGGNTPQALVSDASERVRRGQLDVAILCGGEAHYGRTKLRAEGGDLVCTEQRDVDPDERFGADVDMSSDHERDLGFVRATEVYPLFESAIRHARGESIDEHRTRIGELWHTFNQVAVDNPYAWVRTPMTAAEIRDESPTNRMVGFPYPKAMNANMYVDQAAAVVVMSVEVAESMGLSRDRWVFPLVATQAHDTLRFAERQSMHRAPAIGVAGRKVLDVMGLVGDDIDYFDLYSCFPAVVQMTAEELAIELRPGRPLTSTGGLSFFGGPLNSYVMHGVASLIEKVRADPGTTGLIHANGGYATKHAFCLYSTEPAAEAFRTIDVQADVDQLPTRSVAEDYDGSMTIESYTVMHGRDGATKALLTGLIDDGRRVLARSSDADLMTTAVRQELIGQSAHRTVSGEAKL